MKKNLSNIKKAIKYLNNQDCIGIPTETVYGLAGNAYSNQSVNKIFILKCNSSYPAPLEESNLRNIPYLRKKYNKENGITPESIKKNIKDILGSIYERDHLEIEAPEFFEDGILIGDNYEKHIKDLNSKMLKFAEDLDFENAAKIRDEIRRLEEASLKFSNDPMYKENKRYNRKRTKKR